MRRTMIIGSLGALSLAAVVAGCAGGAASPTAPPAASAPATSSVEVTLQEWAVLPATTTVSAGSVTFNVKNVGPKDVHEMVVLKTDLAPDAVPANADGSINEEGAGVEALGEVEDVAVGGTKTVTLDLAPGKYLLLCNIVDGDEVHFKLGMRAPFEVTP
jgi:uncharacterized cupredoxin-like copper-binding protein